MVMDSDARRESIFTVRQAGAAGITTLSVDRLSSKVGPNSRAGTFYILGSGASIEQLTSSDFREIARNTSVGINNWGVHPFVPNIYSLESVPWVGDGRDFPRAIQLLNRPDILLRKPDVLILRPKTAEEIGELRVLPKILRDSVSFYGRVMPATRDSRNLVGDIAQFFSHVAPRSPSVLMDSGASVVRMVVLGVLLGFRRIALAGVDLNGSPYFWEKNPEYLTGLGTATPVNNQTTPTHETTSQSNRAFDVVSMLRAFDTFLQTEFGGKLLVTSSESALAEFFPVETWGRG